MSDAPLILVFDTTAAVCAAALVQDGRILAERSETMKRGQAERLMPMLEEILAERNVSWADLGGLAPCTGPGNFTGIRLSVAAARGLSLALNIPAVGVTGFEAVCHGIPGPVLALLDTGRGEMSGQLFVNAQPVSEATPDPGRLNLPTGCVCAGVNATDTARALHLPCIGKTPADILSGIARVAGPRLERKPQMPTPFYMRSADAAPASDQPPPILNDL